MVDKELHKPIEAVYESDSKEITELELTPDFLDKLDEIFKDIEDQGHYDDTE